MIVQQVRIVVIEPLVQCINNAIILPGFENGFVIVATPCLIVIFSFAESPATGIQRLDQSLIVNRSYRAGLGNVVIL